MYVHDNKYTVVLSSSPHNQLHNSVILSISFNYSSSYKYNDDGEYMAFHTDH